MRRFDITTDSRDLDILSFLIDYSERAGADKVDALLIRKQSLSASVRLGVREDIDASEGADLGLRVFIGARQAIVATSDLGRESLEQSAERAIAMAKVTPEDPYACLADKDRLYSGGPDYDLHDDRDMSADELAAIALEAEDAARAVGGVSNSEGGGAQWSRAQISLATSHGFAASKAGTSGSISASVLAGQGTGMERDYDYTTARHWADLESAALVGRRAGERAVRRLNPDKIKTGDMPVIFDPRAGQSLLGHLSSAVNGQSIARGTSFLRSKMGQSIFNSRVNIIDDPTRRRGLKSRHFDAEGVACEKLALVQNGELKSWFLDSATGKQLNLPTTGHAARAPSGPPSPTASNLYMEAGDVSVSDLLSDIKSGFYVTELIGMGVNGVTGDYSRGASGFLIENGEITKPVSEITIAGNLLDMYAALTPADDLEFRYGMNVPTLRIERMTIAGS